MTRLASLVLFGMAMLVTYWLFPSYSATHRLPPDPPPLIVTKASPPILGPLPPSHTLSLTYQSALDLLSRSAVEVNRRHSPSRRMAGIPGTAIRNNEEAKQIQAWLNCHASDGQFVWQPTGRSKVKAGLTVHKMGVAAAVCDKVHYKNNQGSSHHGWDVRPSLKYTWKASTQCDSLLPSKLSPVPSELSRRRFCQLLRHKSILVVGDSATQYAMHDLLVDFASTVPVTCYGDQYCKEHGLCGNELSEGWKGDYAGLEHGAFDRAMYTPLPLPFKLDAYVNNKIARRHNEEILENITSHSRPHVKRLQPPLSDNKVKTYGTILRYRRSDGLWGSSSTSHSRFNPVFIHGNTGVREFNNHWATDARRSDVVILAKPPLPFPQETSFSNSFIRPHDVSPDHFSHLTSQNRPFQTTFETLMQQQQQQPIAVVEAAKSLIELAARTTTEIWLPEVIQTLVGTRTGTWEADQLFVWRSEWRIQNDCQHDVSSTPASSSAGKLAASGDPTSFHWKNWWSAQTGDGNAPKRSPPNLLDFMFHSPKLAQQHDRPASNPKKMTMLDDDDKLNTLSLQPLHVIYHNLQVTFQNQLLQLILPTFGIVFLDLESPLSVWSSGLIGGANHHDAVDCTRYCFPSPGMSMEDIFLGGLQRLFQVGWASNSKHEQTWTGSGFVPFRYRQGLVG